MSQESDDKQNMRPEYDVRGGVRGKYLDRYRKGTSITFAESPFIFKSTTDTAPVGFIMRSASYPTLQPSPKILFDSPLTAGYARQDSPRG